MKGTAMRSLILAAMALTVGISAAGAETLTIGSSADYPPWESVNAANEIVGFDRDVGDEICTRIGAECTWVNQAFDGLLPGLQIGRFDLIMSGLSINEERAQQVDFSVAYADAPNNLVVAAGNEAANATDAAALVTAMDGKTIGVQTGSTHAAVLAAHFPNSEVRLYERAEQVGDDLVAGRIDAGLMERSAWEGIIEARGGESLVFAGPLLTTADFPEFGQGQAIAIKKGREDLKARIDEAVSAMLADGTIARLSQASFEYDLSYRGQ